MGLGYLIATCTYIPDNFNTEYIGYNFLNFAMSSVLQSVRGLVVPDGCPLVGGWTRQTNVFLHCMKPKNRDQHKQGIWNFLL
jgi:hypothetical protein